MIKNGRRKSNPKRSKRGKEPRQIRLNAEPWYAGAARSIGISTRDQTRRVATGPNALPP